MEKNENFDDLTENSPPIQYLLIGDTSTNKIITEYSSTINSSKIKKEINQIFSKICKNQSKKYNERNKISSKDTIYYFTLVKPNYVFIILVEDEYPEELVFELIDKITEEKIATMVNEETQELNPNGRVELKNIIDSYQKKNEEENDNEDNKEKKDKDNKDNMDNLKIDGIKDKKDSENQSKSTEEIEDFNTKNDVFLLTNDKSKCNFCRKIYLMNNYKIWLIMSIIVLILLIIVIVI